MIRPCLLFAVAPVALLVAADPEPRSLQPSVVTAGGPSFSLHVDGVGFNYSTRVLWNGARLVTYFESDTRLIAEVPSARIAAPGAVEVAVTLADGKPSVALNLTINPGLAWITVSPLAPAPQSQFYAQAFTVSGGTPPVRFALQSGHVPAGLHLDGYNGTVVGFATVAGQYDFEVRATDRTGASASQTFRLAVAGELKITTALQLPAASPGRAYLAQLAAEGGVPPISEWKIVAGALPAGLALDEKTGRIAGALAVAAGPGQVQFTVRARDSTGRAASKAFSLEVRAPLSIALPDRPGDFAEGDSVEMKLSAAGGAPPYVWAVEGAGLPPGLELDPRNGILQGTLEKAGSWRPMLLVREAGGSETRTALAFVVAPRLAIAVPAFGSAVVGVAFEVRLSGSGGTPPYAWIVADSAIPPGMRFESGRLSGTPQSPGRFPLTTEIRDSTGRIARAGIAIDVTVPPLPALQLAPLARLRPGEQTKLDVRLERAYLTALEAVVKLAFDGPADPAVLLSTGGREARLSIPAGQLVPTQPLSLQTGTSAGTITLEARLGSEPPIVLSAPVDALPPKIQSVNAQRSIDGFEVAVIAFSPTREIGSALFNFDEGTQLELPISGIVDAWYAGESSTGFGTLFTYRQKFIVRGDLSRLRGVAVTLTNRIGASIPVGASF